MRHIPIRVVCGKRVIFDAPIPRPSTAPAPLLGPSSGRSARKSGYWSNLKMAEANKLILQPVPRVADSGPGRGRVFAGFELACPIAEIAPALTSAPASLSLLLRGPIEPPRRESGGIASRVAASRIPPDPAMAAVMPRSSRASLPARGFDGQTFTKCTLPSVTEINECP